MDSIEFLRNLTVLIEGEKTESSASLEVKKSSSGTGFFVKLNGETIIVTAKHVADEAKDCTFYLRYKFEEHIVTVPISVSVDWISHDNQDLACCKLKPIEEKFKKITEQNIYYTSIAEENIITEVDEKNIKGLPEIIMIGDPQGVGSTHHKYGLFKKGNLATPMSDNFENDIGYADISSISGYSGSPLILNNSASKLVGILVESFAENILSVADMCMYVSAHHILKFKKRLKDNKERK